MLSDNIEKCPHCGDTEEGYYYTVTHRYVQDRGWGNDESENSADEEAGGNKHSACRCSACKRIVRDSLLNHKD